MGPGATIDAELTTLRGAAVSSSGRLIVTYGADALRNVVSVWDVAARSFVQRFDPNAEPLMVRFTPDETALIGGLISRQNGRAEVVRWSLSPAPSSVAAEDGIMFQQPSARGIALSRDAHTVVIRLHDGGLVVVDLATGTSALTGTGTFFTGVCVSPSGALIAAADENAITVFTSQRGRGSSPAVELAGVVRSGKPESMDCSDTIVVAAFDDRIEMVWATPSRSVAAVRVPGPVRRIALSSDAGLLAAAQDDHVTLVDWTDGSIRGEIVTPIPVQRLTYGLENQLLVTAHADGAAQLWDVSAQPSFSGNWGRLAPAAVLAMAYADGFRAASGHSMIEMDHLVLGLYRADQQLARELSLSAGGSPDEEGLSGQDGRSGPAGSHRCGAAQGPCGDGGHLDARALPRGRHGARVS